jgi:DNA primase small subunit
MKITKQKMGVEIAGETDEPVTSDIKRVIRIPGSVHGGSGLLAMSLKLSELKDFDPLSTAMLPTLTDSSIKVKWQKKMEIRLGKERFSGEPGTETELPERAAFVLVARGGATIEA